MVFKTIAKNSYLIYFHAFEAYLLDYQIVWTEQCIRIKHNEINSSRDKNEFSELKINNPLLIAILVYNYKLH